MTPTQLEGESDKAFEAFCIYINKDGKTSRVAKKLRCSGQNIRKWALKFNWRNRLEQLRLEETRRMNTVEERSRQKASDITELERASVARRAFDTASEFIDHARKIATKHPLSAARLLDIGVSVAAQVGGAASGYQVPEVAIHVVSQFSDEPGAPLDQPPITSIEQAEKIIAEHESKRSVIAWERNDADAAAEDHASKQAPVVFMREENEDLVIDHAAKIPMRGGDEVPTTDHALRGPGWVKVEGL